MRLDRLERASSPVGDGWRPYDAEEGKNRALDWVKAVGGPQTPEEAEAAGYSCVMESVAGRLGMTLKEFRQVLKDIRNQNPVEYKTVGSRCYVRRCPGLQGVA